MYRRLKTWTGRAKLRVINKLFTLPASSEIGSGLIATFRLAASMEIKLADSGHTIDVILEMPPPNEPSCKGREGTCRICYRRWD